ncbi:hypothetical protein AGMMS49975_25030 [Clostridia bacterium]|nr:hypothetical protein AGMMS49975_25030 [Clostridia bacterium]
MALSEYQTEVIGISAEIAIADAYGVRINAAYRQRGNADIVSATLPVVKYAFSQYEIPMPIEHIAEGQNPVDFRLAENKTLSVKTNQKKLGKIAPQRVGQVSSQTYFNYFEEYYDDVPADYAERCLLFKREVFNRIDVFARVYWDNLFDCDFLIHFYDFLSRSNTVQTPSFIVLDKRVTPNFIYDNFSFTKNANTWNESNTVKYNGVTIGEFQVHNHRDNFKFRFNMNGIYQLILQGVL